MLIGPSIHPPIHPSELPRHIVKLLLLPRISPVLSLSTAAQYVHPSPLKLSEIVKIKCNIRAEKCVRFSKLNLTDILTIIELSICLESQFHIKLTEYMKYRKLDMTCKPFYTCNACVVADILSDPWREPKRGV